jgi:4-amino-4-deoxy-L-arabinose transferase-like glycosyltransferase
MLLPVGVAILIQSGYVWGVHRSIYHNGDAVYYDFQAKLITKGYWFVNPYDFAWKSTVTPSASHPPLTTLVLAGADELGASTWTWHIAVMAAVFVVTVGICGLVGRQLAGARAGVVVALVVATYPYLWVNPAAVLAETIELLLVALVLWAAIRFSKRPQFRTAAELGLYLGLAALTRAELTLLMLLIGAPLVLGCRRILPLRRLKCLGVMGLVIVVIVGPWVGRNLTTFHHREYLSTEGGVTLATANCNPTYYGGDIGGWSFSCDVAKVPANADESDIDGVERHEGVRYIEAHKSRVVVVVAVRVLREWDLYRPIQQAQFDRSDARPAWVSESGMVYFYLLAPLAIAGAVMLRRRRALLFPLVAVVVTATIAAALFFANGRYRAEGDLGLAILGGIGIDALIGRCGGHAGGGGEARGRGRRSTQARVRTDDR